MTADVRRLALLACLGLQALSLVSFLLAFGLGSYSESWVFFTRAGWAMLLASGCYCLGFALLLVLAFIKPVARSVARRAPAAPADFVDFADPVVVHLAGPQGGAQPGMSGRGFRLATGWSAGRLNFDERWLWWLSFAILVFGLLFCGLVLLLVFGSGSASCCSFGL